MKLKLMLIFAFIIYIHIPLSEFYTNVFATNNFFTIAFWVSLSIYDFWQLGNLIGWIKDLIFAKPKKY